MKEIPSYVERYENDGYSENSTASKLRASCVPSAGAARVSRQTGWWPLPMRVMALAMALLLVDASFRGVAMTLLLVDGVATTPRPYSLLEVR